MNIRLQAEMNTEWNLHCNFTSHFFRCFWLLVSKLLETSHKYSFSVRFASVHSLLLHDRFTLKCWNFDGRLWNSQIGLVEHYELKPLTRIWRPNIVWFTDRATLRMGQNSEKNWNCWKSIRMHQNQMKFLFCSIKTNK